jgi:SHS2 domain-containing protein
MIGLNLLCKKKNGFKKCVSSVICVAESMDNKKRFRFLEHTADAYVAAYGKDLAEAFENAALAMFEVMTNVGKVNPQSEELVDVEAEDEYALLYSWLEALLVKSDTDGMLYSKFRILEISENPNGFELKARVWGEKFNPEKHLQKVGVKAVTYHRMEIIREKTRVTLKFILDI